MANININTTELIQLLDIMPATTSCWSGDTASASPKS